MMYQTNRNKSDRPFNNNRSGYNNNPASNNRNGYNTKESADEKYKSMTFEADWIKKGANPELVEYAENAGFFMAKNGLTNSKIRSIYREIKRIQMGEFENEKSSFYLLKPKVAYALGRDKDNAGLKLFKLIFDEASKNVTDKKTYINFCNLIEAILAYHKANGGND